MPPVGLARMKVHLAPAVQWLMSVVAQIPVEASEVIQELCGHLVQQMDGTSFAVELSGGSWHACANSAACA